MATYTITYEKYKEYAKTNKITVPSWLKEKQFNEAMKIMIDQGKQHVCKFLIGLSDKYKTRQRFDLKWSKVDVADVIDSFRVPVVVSEKGMGTVNVAEVLRVLAPFSKMAKECLYNSNLHHDQVVYAYNSAQITMQNLRDVENMITQLKVIE